MADTAPESGDKAGKVLSAENAKAIIDSLAALKAVLSKAGIEDSPANKMIDEVAIEVATKCGYDVAMPFEPPPPYGGATSFDEVTSFAQAQEQSEVVSNIADQFQAIYSNVMGSDDLTAADKAKLIAQAARDMQTRIQTMNDADEDDMSGKSLVARAKGWLGIASKADAPTKSENGKSFKAEDYADIGDPDKPSTWKLRLSNTPGSPDPGVIADAITALGPGGFRGNKVELGSPKPKVISRISGAIGKSGADDTQRKNLEERLAAVKSISDIDFGSTPSDGGAHIFQDKDGTWRWLGIWSNDRKDKEAERFPETAHKEFIEWADSTKTLPELWGYHTPGSKCGTAEMVDIHEGFTIAAGKFDAGSEDIARRLSEQGAELGMSHGYVYRPSEKQNGEIKRYRTFELSFLPRGKAANEGTAFMADKEEPMNATKEAWLRSIYGDAKTDAMKTRITEFQKSLGDEGGASVGIKEVIEALLDPSGAVPAASKADHQHSMEAAKPGSDQAPSPADTAQGLKALGEIIANAVKEGTDPITAQLAPLAAIPAEIAGMKNLLETHSTQLLALKEADDTKIAQAFAPQAKKATEFPSATEQEKGAKDVGDDESKRLLAAAGVESDDPIAGYMELMSGRARVAV